MRITTQLVLAMGFGAIAGPNLALADNTPKDIAVVKQVIISLKVADIWQFAGAKGIQQSKLPAAQAAKVQKLFAANFRKAIPALQTKLAAREAGHFTSAQIADIKKLSEVPAYQPLMMNAAEGKPDIDVNTIPADQQAVIGDLGNKDFVKKFNFEILNDPASNKTMIEILKKSVVAAQ
jgi:hypothetical protein